mmetsp:Transcript_87722/g.256409  ORF Transcript_87722/g.256409 Transcript_87722/m.256409 type:complete len:207 (-) Transcript_87722:1549-2169(-)
MAPARESSDLPPRRSGRPSWRRSWRGRRGRSCQMRSGWIPLAGLAASACSATAAGAGHRPRVARLCHEGQSWQRGVARLVNRPAATTRRPPWRRAAPACRRSAAPCPASTAGASSGRGEAGTAAGGTPRDAALAAAAGRWTTRTWRPSSGASWGSGGRCPWRRCSGAARRWRSGPTPRASSSRGAGGATARTSRSRACSSRSSVQP